MPKPKPYAYRLGEFKEQLARNKRRRKTEGDRSRFALLGFPAQDQGRLSMIPPQREAPPVNSGVSGRRYGGTVTTLRLV